MPHKDPVKAKEYKKRYYQVHKKELDEKNKQWVKNHPEELRKIQVRYEHTEKGKLSLRKKEHKYVKSGKNKICLRRAWMKRYGLTLEQYDQMFESQDGVCAICGESEKSKLSGVTKRLAVDHDHRTGKVRGLLCTTCNTVLGNAKDSIEILSRAISYLTKHSVPES